MESRRKTPSIKFYLYSYKVFLVCQLLTVSNAAFNLFYCIYFITFSHNMSIWNKLKPYSLYFHWNKYGTIFRNNIFKTQWLSDNIPEEMQKCAIDIFSKTDLNISYALIVFGKSYFFLYWAHPIGLNPAFHKNYNIFDRRQYNLSTNSQSMQVLWVYLGQ